MLKFNLSEVIPILDHAERSRKHRPRCGHPNDGAGLWLVKDSGVYLMSNGDPAQKNPAKKSDPKATELLVVYAEGHDPRKGDTWEADRAECGGDDFTELIEAAVVRRAIDAGCATMGVKMSARTFQVEFRK